MVDTSWQFPFFNEDAENGYEVNAEFSNALKDLARRDHISLETGGDLWKMAVTDVCIDTASPEKEWALRDDVLLQECNHDADDDYISG